MRAWLIDLFAIAYNASLLGIPVWLAAKAFNPGPARWGQKAVPHPTMNAVILERELQPPHPIDRRRAWLMAIAIFAASFSAMAFFQANAHNIVRAADRMFERAD